MGSNGKARKILSGVEEKALADFATGSLSLGDVEPARSGARKAIELIRQVEAGVPLGPPG